MCFANTDPMQYNELIDPTLKSLRDSLANTAMGQVGKSTPAYTGPLVAQTNPMFNAGASMLMGLGGYGPYKAPQFTPGKNMANTTDQRRLQGGSGVGGGGGINGGVINGGGGPYGNPPQATGTFSQTQQGPQNTPPPQMAGGDYSGSSQGYSQSPYDSGYGSSIYGNQSPYSGFQDTNSYTPQGYYGGGQQGGGQNPLMMMLSQMFGGQGGQGGY